MKDLDLTLILQGYEGEKLWSPVWGDCWFLEIHSRSGGRPMIKVQTRSGDCRNVTPGGCLGYNYESTGGECILWPSKDQQDWSDWGKGLWAVRIDTGEVKVYYGFPNHNLTPTIILPPCELPNVTQENSPYKLE